MKKIIAIIFGVIFTSSLLAQENGVNILTTSPDVQEVSVTRFEDPGYWEVYTPLDNGISVHTRLRGGPDAKQPLTGDQVIGFEENDEHVLGVRTDFMRRGFTEITIASTRPVAVPGIAQEISLWVAGRSLDHELWIVVNDVNTNTKELFAGTLNFQGWRQVTIPIPPFEEDRRTGFKRGIRQFDPHFPDREGIEIIGFKVRPNFLETYGSYYIYFDDLRAVTDLNNTLQRDPDDPIDSW